jgi:Family of unknown function (DUF5372)
VSSVGGVSRRRPQEARLCPAEGRPSCGWRSGRSSGWNAYLRRVRAETVVITHPSHPLSGKALAVLHYRPKGRVLSVLVELPDGSAQCLPVSWTDRARPDPHRAVTVSGARLSGLALLELVGLVESWEKKR